MGASFLLGEAIQRLVALHPLVRWVPLRFLLLPTLSRGYKGLAFQVASLDGPLGATSGEHDNPEGPELWPNFRERFVVWRKGSVPGYRTECLQRNSQDVPGKLSLKREPLGRWGDGNLASVPWQVADGP